MTEAEARIVFEVISDADGGCSCCVRELFRDLVKKLPELEALAREYWAAQASEGRYPFDDGGRCPV